MLMSELIWPFVNQDLLLLLLLVAIMTSLSLLMRYTYSSFFHSSLINVILFKKIREVDRVGNLIASIKLANRNYVATRRDFNLVSTPVPEYCSSCEILDYVRFVSGGGPNNKVWTSNTTLENRAFIQYAVSFFSLLLLFFPSFSFICILSTNVKLTKEGVAI